jgi:hypothetical protein
MKVITEDVTLILLDSLRDRLKHTVNSLKLSVDHGAGSDLDLIIANGNLAQAERLISFIKENSFNARAIYQTTSNESESEAV